MEYVIDTEFIENGVTIDLISIGIVAMDGRSYYAVNRQCDYRCANDWVWKNVLNPMGMFVPVPDIQYEELNSAGKETVSKFATRNQIAQQIIGFTAGTDPKFWAYYGDYDWVVFCQLFGTMMDLPKGFPMYCKDIKQECDRLGNPALPAQTSGEHNALSDADWGITVLRLLRSHKLNTGAVQ